MRITIYAPDINLTPDINDYLEKKISSLEKLIPSLKSRAGKSDQMTAEIRIKIEKETERVDIYKVGAEVILSRQVIGVAVQNQDIFQAIDEIKDKLQREIRRYGSKKETMRRRAVRAFKRMRLRSGEKPPE